MKLTVSQITTADGVQYAVFDTEDNYKRLGRFDVLDDAKEYAEQRKARYEDDLKQGKLFDDRDETTTVKEI